MWTYFEDLPFGFDEKMKIQIGNIVDDSKKLQLHDLKVAVKRVIENFRRLQDFWEEKSKGEHQLISNDVQKDTLNSTYKLHGPIYVHIKRNVTVETKIISLTDIYTHERKGGCRDKHVLDEKSNREDQHILKDVQIDTFNTVYKVHGPIHVHINRKVFIEIKMIFLNEFCLRGFQRFKKSIIIQARQPYATRQIHIVDNEIFPKLKTVWEEKTKAEEHRHILNDTQIDTFNTVYKLHGPIYVHIHRKKNVKTMIIAVNEKCPSRQTETFKSFLAGTGVLRVCFVLVRMLMPHSVNIRLI